MLPHAQRRYTTAEKDTYDLWIQIVSAASVETVDRFLVLAEALDTVDGQPWQTSKAYQMRQHVNALIAGGLLVAVNPSAPEATRQYHTVGVPPWGPRRPTARRK